MGFTFISKIFLYISVQSIHIFIFTHSHKMAESHHLITNIVRVMDNNAIGPEVGEEDTRGRGL